jgi:DNA primase
MTRRIVAVYDYRTARNRLVYQLVRFEPKGFGCRRRPDGPLSDGIQSAPQLLYRLPELLAASPVRPVYWVEGEKDVESLRALGQVATCQAWGCNASWSPRYARWLRRRTVIILPDNDVPGREHASRVAGELLGSAASVRVVSLPGLRPKADVSDWLAAGGTLEQLAQLTTATPERLVAFALDGGKALNAVDWYRHVDRTRDLEAILGLPVSAQEKLLLIILRAGVVRPKLTQRVIARAMGLTPRRVKQLIAGLQDRGILMTARKRRYDARGDRTPRPGYRPPAKADTRMTDYRVMLPDPE